MGCASVFAGAPKATSGTRAVIMCRMVLVTYKGRVPRLIARVSTLNLASHINSLKTGVATKYTSLTVSLIPFQDFRTS